MDVFCEKCRKTVGRVDDSKITPGRKLTVSCPHCGEKIALGADMEPPEIEPEISSADSSADMATAQPPAPAPDPAAGADLAIGRVISEAWKRTRGLKGPVWGSYFILLVGIGVLNLFAGFLAAMMGHGPMAIGFAVAVQVSVSLLSYPFMAGIMMMGVYRSVDRPVSFRMAFEFFGFLVPVILATVLVAILTMFGFSLLLIPGIYLSVAYLCVLPLIIDKQMGAWQAMETSRKGVSKSWFTVFLIYMVLLFIVMISAIPMGIGLIWTLPMLIAANGIIYRDIFGVSEG